MGTERKLAIVDYANDLIFSDNKTEMQAIHRLLLKSNLAYGANHSTETAVTAIHSHFERNVYQSEKVRVG